MIQLKDVAYVRLGAPDLAQVERFATSCLGLQVSERVGKSVYLRSDDRAHTLCYFEGDPEDQTVAFEVECEAELTSAGATLEALGHHVHLGTETECAERKVRAFIGFQDPTGNKIELVVGPAHSGRRYFPTRDAGITGFSHIGLNTTDAIRDEQFWTQVCNARVSDRIGDLALLRIHAVHHTMALAPAAKRGIGHINHQVQSNDDVLRSYYYLRDQRIPIVFGPGRHPTSGARFVYFVGPNNMIYEYSTGVRVIEDEGAYEARQFNFEPASLCMWGSKLTRPAAS